MGPFTYDVSHQGGGGVGLIKKNSDNLVGFEKIQFLIFFGKGREALLVYSD